jgi:hypothetical protein
VDVDKTGWARARSCQAINEMAVPEAEALPIYVRLSSSKKLILPLTRNMVIRSFSTTHSAFLIQNERIPRNVFDASVTASRHASSKPFGDWAMTSIERTIDMVFLRALVAVGFLASFDLVKTGSVPAGSLPFR